MGLDAPGTGLGAQTVSSVTTPATGSISLWVRPTDLGSEQRIMAIADDFEGRMDYLGNFTHEWGKGGRDAIGVTMTEGTLYHVVGTWEDATGDGQWYVDGILNESADTEYGNPSNGTITMFDRSGSNDPWEGELYDARIYNRVLSAAEILTIYNSRGADSIVYGLLHRWTLDEEPDGSTLSGTGAAKDRAQNQNNFSSAAGAPSYIYNGNVVSRRRAA